jgi:glycosyltransferase involved in cell wall biosynthesis
MKVALVHDWLTGMRGGEKVLLSLARLFPDAPIHTLLHVRGSVRPELESREIHTSFIQRLPWAARHYRHYLPLFPAAIAGFDFSGFDLVLSSSHCVAKGARAPAGAVHVCYCHTPMRYVWDRFDDYFGPARVSPLVRPAIRVVAHALRRWDVATSRGVHHFVANSNYVAERIRRYYGRQADVVSPPVDTDFFTPATSPSAGEYDLIVSALVPYKRIELALAAYRDSGRRLLIAGSGPMASRLAQVAPSEARFLGHVDDCVLRDLYRGCRAVLLTGVEDFGIVPVEAMACGRPAVVFSEGGAAEAVVEGETGLVFHAPTAQALRAAVDALSVTRFNTAVLRARAEAYGPAAFDARMRDVVSRAIERHLERPQRVEA